MAPATGKSSVFIQIPKKGISKECSNYCTTVLISHASKVMLKILQARLRQYVNQELADVKAGLRKDRQNRDQLTSIRCITETREFQKKTSASLITLKSLIVWITRNCGKF